MEQLQDTSISKPLYFIEKDHGLTTDRCNATFFNSLRCDTDNPGHIETKITFVPIKVNRNKKIPISHIFTGEDPRTIRSSSLKRFYTPSHILFDSYHKENYKKNPSKIRKYEIENRMRQQNESSCSSTRNSSLMYKRITDNYLHNPVRTYNNDEIKKYNDEIKRKNQRHSAAYGAILNSKNFKRTLGGVKNLNNGLRIIDTSKQMDKIVNNSVNINKASIAINRNKNKIIPYYGRRKIKKNNPNENDKKFNKSCCIKRD